MDSELSDCEATEARLTLLERGETPAPEDYMLRPDEIAIAAEFARRRRELDRPKTLDGALMGLIWHAVRRSRARESRPQGRRIRSAAASRDGPLPSDDPDPDDELKPPPEEGAA
jgi:hypothetical protein